MSGDLHRSDPFYFEVSKLSEDLCKEKIDKLLKPSKLIFSGMNESINTKGYLEILRHRFIRRKASKILKSLKGRRCLQRTGGERREDFFPTL